MLFIKFIILPLTLLLLIVGSGLAEPISIRFSSQGDQNSPKGKASEYFKRLVEQRSDNRIRVTVNPESPANDQRSIEDLNLNRIQMAAPAISELYSLNPQLRLFERPFLFNNLMHLHSVIDGEVGTQLMEGSSQGELVALSFWDNGFRQLTANRPLRRPEQAAGLRIHIQAPEVLKHLFLQLGAEPQTIKPEQLYAALKETSLDGQENTLVAIERQQLYQVQSDLTISNHCYTGFLVVTNKHFWLQLPEDLKVIVKGAIKSAAEYTRDMAAQLNAESFKKIRASNQIAIHRLTSEERKLWSDSFQRGDTEPQNSIANELARKARELKIR